MSHEKKENREKKTKSEKKRISAKKSKIIVEVRQTIKKYKNKLQRLST
jgi:hypothetical protein